MADPSKVLTEALDLPVRERLRIAGALLRSVDPYEAAAAWHADHSPGAGDDFADAIDDLREQLSHDRR